MEPLSLVRVFRSVNGGVCVHNARQRQIYMLQYVPTGITKRPHTAKLSSGAMQCEDKKCRNNFERF